MSVLKSQRGASTMQFIQTARELAEYTTAVCRKLPKSLTFFGGSQLWTLAREILSHVTRANSVYPTNAHELQERRDCFIKANEAVQDFLVQLDMLKPHVEPKKFQEMVRLATAEATLISACKTADAKRYKF